MTALERLMSEAATLDGADRRTLAAHLHSSMDARQVQLILDGMIEHDPEWLAELERRDRAYEAVSLKLIPYREFVADLKARRT